MTKLPKDEIVSRVRGEVESLAAVSIENPDQEIFKSGILDSMNVLNIITFLESEFAISIDPFDLSLETLDTVNKIAGYVDSKLG